MNKALKFRIYPNREQKVLIGKTFGCVRFIFNGFGYFVTMLEYKLIEQGKELVKIDKWFLSSKMCSNCGAVRKSLPLSERVYHCENCGVILDRDLNASYNIREEGKQLLLQKQKHRTVGHTGSGRKQVCCSTKQPG